MSALPIASGDRGRSDPFAPGLLARLPLPLQKVALVRASRLGDFICATPGFRALRAALPGAEITLIGLPQLRELAVRSPYLDRFEAFPGFPGIAEQFFEARRTTEFLERMQAERFDLAVQLHGTGVFANPFTLLLGARAAAGWVRPGDPAGLLQAALPMPAGLHEVDRVLALTTFLGAAPQGRTTEYRIQETDQALAERLLGDARSPLIGLHPGAGAELKRWPEERFAAVGRELQRQRGGTLVVVGGAADWPLAEAVTREAASPARNLAGATGVSELGAVVGRLAVLISNDSGPAHVAYALGTPTVTIFGPTDPRRWGPPVPGPHAVVSSGEACRGCDEAPCSLESLCLGSVSVEQVLVAAEQVMGQG